MPLVEILDGPPPPEWAGVVYESPEDMVTDEIGLIHPRWRPGTRVDSVIIRRTVNPGR